jgi:hypothetical protein
MTIWDNTQKNIGQVGITYNEIGKTYNQTEYTYWGLVQTIFSNLSKAVTSFTNQTRITNTTFSNQTKN